MKKAQKHLHRSLLTILVCVVLLLLGTPLFAGGTQEERSSSASEEETSSKDGSEAIVKAGGETILSYLEGTVLINGEQGKIGQEVPVGATIETKENSYCDITFGEKNIFRIESETVTTFSIGADEKSIQVERGSVGAVLEKLQSLSGDREVRLKSPSVVAGIRGTVFYLKVENPDTTFLCTCHGTVHQHHSADDQPTKEEITASHHKAFRYSSTEEGPKKEPADMLYHNDASMNAISNRIGVDIPWGTLK